MEIWATFLWFGSPPTLKLRRTGWGIRSPKYQKKKRYPKGYRIFFWLQLVNAFRTVNWKELEQELKLLNLQPAI